MECNNNNVMLGSGSFIYEKQLINKFKDKTCFILDAFGEFARDEDYRFIDFSKESINPFDFAIRPTLLDGSDVCKDIIDMDIALQYDYLIDLFEIIGNNKLSPAEKHVIYNVLNSIYKPYEEYLLNNKISYDSSKCPCLKDFYEKIKDNIVLKKLALTLEIFVDIPYLNKTSFDIEPGEKIIYQTSIFNTGFSLIMQIICYHNMWVNSMKLGYEEKYLFLNYLHDEAISYLSHEIKRFRTSNIFCFLRFPWQADIQNIFENRGLVNNINHFYLFKISESDVDFLAKEFYLDEEEKQKIKDNCCNETFLNPYIT